MAAGGPVTSVTGQWHKDKGEAASLLRVCLTASEEDDIVACCKTQISPKDNSRPEAQVETSPFPFNMHPSMLTAAQALFTSSHMTIYSPLFRPTV